MHIRCIFRRKINVAIRVIVLLVERVFAIAEGIAALINSTLKSLELFLVLLTFFNELLDLIDV